MGLHVAMTPHVGREIDVARERPEMIEACNERKRPRTRQPSIGRLQSKDSAERRWHPDRAVGIRPQCQRHQAAADRSLVLPVYPARERQEDFPGVGAQLIAAAVRERLAELGAMADSAARVSGSRSRTSRAR